MNKKQLADKVAEQLKISKKDAYTYVTCVFDTMSDILANDGSVDIYGFGKFSVSTRAGRIGINPRTKEEIEIDSTRSVKFKVSKTLKDLVK
ncbi:MAG: HU family DNA-binding protein [Holdemanella sp.]|nr:HU family DNA-binding protein [Holdemanella sp.]